MILVIELRIVLLVVVEVADIVVLVQLMLLCIICGNGDNNSVLIRGKLHPEGRTEHLKRCTEAQKQTTRSFSRQGALQQAYTPLEVKLIIFGR